MRCDCPRRLIRSTIGSRRDATDAMCPHPRRTDTPHRTRTRAAHHHPPPPVINTRLTKRRSDQRAEGRADGMQDGTVSAAIVHRASGAAVWIQVVSLRNALQGARCMPVVVRRSVDVAQLCTSLAHPSLTLTRVDTAPTALPSSQPVPFDEIHRHPSAVLRHRPSPPAPQFSRAAQICPRMSHSLDVPNAGRFTFQSPSAAMRHAINQGNSESVHSSARDGPACTQCSSQTSGRSEHLLTHACIRVCALPPSV